MVWRYGLGHLTEHFEFHALLYYDVPVCKIYALVSSVDIEF